MKSKSTFSLLLKLAQKSMGKNSKFSGYLSFFVIYAYMIITYHLLTNMFVVIIGNALLFIHVQNSININVHIFLLLIFSLSVVLFLFRFWKWLKEPVFQIDGVLPDDNWYNDRIKEFEKQLDKEEITRFQARFKSMVTLIQMWLGHKGLKYSIPTNPFRTFTSKTITTILAVSFTYAMIYHTLFNINNANFQIANYIPNTIFYQRFIDFIYFSVVTFATIGYGDIYPSSTISKLFVVSEIFSGLIILIIGIASLSLFTLPKIQRAQEAVAKTPHFEELSFDKKPVEEK